MRMQADVTCQDTKIQIQFKFKKEVFCLYLIFADV